MEIKRFIRAYNDVATYPTIRSIATAFDVSERSLRRRRDAAIKAGHKLVNRGSSQVEQKPVAVVDTRHSEVYRSEAKRLANRARENARRDLLADLEDDAMDHNDIISLVEDAYEERNDRILFIPDMHMPYHHPDSFEFLEAVAERYRPTRVINAGDEVDNHGISFHDSDPDLYSAGHELRRARKFIRELAEIFPHMELVDSNHGSLSKRKAKVDGIPGFLLKSYKQIMFGDDRGIVRGPGEEWHWYQDMTIVLPNGTELFVTHGAKKNSVKFAQERGQNVAQGHYHTEFGVQYAANSNRVLWGISGGCLINVESMAFGYGKVFAAKPVLGCHMIIDSVPISIPMVLNRRGRWIGRVI